MRLSLGLSRQFWVVNVFAGRNGKVGDCTALVRLAIDLYKDLVQVPLAIRVCTQLVYAFSVDPGRK